MVVTWACKPGQVAAPGSGKPPGSPAANFKLAREHFSPVHALLCPPRGPKEQTEDPHPTCGCAGACEALRGVASEREQVPRSQEVVVRGDRC